MTDNKSKTPDTGTVEACGIVARLYEKAADITNRAFIASGLNDNSLKIIAEPIVFGALAAIESYDDGSGPAEAAQILDEWRSHSKNEYTQETMHSFDLELDYMERRVNGSPWKDVFEVVFCFYYQYIDFIKPAKDDAAHPLNLLLTEAAETIKHDLFLKGAPNDDTPEWHTLQTLRADAHRK